MPLDIPKPTNLNPTLLSQQLLDAGFPEHPNWMYLDQDENGVGDTIRFLDLDESDRETVEAVFANHANTAVAEQGRVQEWAINENTTRDKMIAALIANKEDITTNNAIIAAPSFNQAQIANAIKELANQSSRQARQINGIIRTMNQKFDEVD